MPQVDTDTVLRIMAEKILDETAEPYVGLFAEGYVKGLCDMRRYLMDKLNDMPEVKLDSVWEIGVKPQEGDFCIFTDGKRYKFTNNHWEPA